MFTHFILTATSYAKHRRIALDTIIPDSDQMPDLSMIEEVRSRNIHHLPTSFHMKSVDGATVEKLIETDPYFDGVYFCESPDEFISYLEMDMHVSSLEIGKYILSIMDCSKLKLQKLVYLAYAEYLAKTGNKLFEDKIFAFQYGPVCEDLYAATRQNGKEWLRKILIPDFDEKSQLVYECRLARAEDGNTKTEVILDVIEKYGELSPERLVNVTHRPGSPWDHCYQAEKSWISIPDALIQEYHSTETI